MFSKCVYNYCGDTEDLGSSVVYKGETFIADDCYTVIEIDYTIHTFYT
jgi:hypothetical protein